MIVTSNRVIGKTSRPSQGALTVKAVNSPKSSLFEESKAKLLKNKILREFKRLGFKDEGLFEELDENVQDFVKGALKKQRRKASTVLELRKHSEELKSQVQKTIDRIKQVKVNLGFIVF